MTNDCVFAPDLVAAAREFIRSDCDRCVVIIYQLLDELSGKFGDRFDVSSDTYEVLDLIETLWADPHVDQVPDTGWIEFARNEQGFDQVPDTGLLAMLRDRLIAQARKEDR
jgi:hypothetical protein